MAFFSALAAASLSGCPAMYGPPVSDRVDIHGKVTTADGTAIPGIRIVASRDGQQTLSNPDGTYAISMLMEPGDTTTMSAIDIDGAQNLGDFTTAQVTVTHATLGQDTTVTENFTLVPRP